LNLVEFEDDTYFIWVQRGIVLALGLLSFLVGVAVLRRLRMKGMSPNLRKEFMVRHMTYLFLYMMMILNVMIELFSTEISKATGETE
jgi:hypothetical protein